MDVPESVLDAVRTAAVAHLGDVSVATKAAVRAVRALDDFEETADLLIELAVQELVYRARTGVTLAVARQAAYTGPPRVNVTGSAAVNRVAQSVFNHAIGGTRLGDLTGESLSAIAESEAEIARGHVFNAELCAWCIAQGVTGKKRVRDVIPEEKLKRAYNRLRKPGAVAAKAA